MHSKQFTQKQKLTAILKIAGGIGIKEAAKIAYVHYTTIYDWRHRLDGLGEERFLAYQPSYPGRGIKVISAEKEASPVVLRRMNFSSAARNQEKEAAVPKAKRSLQWRLKDEIAISEWVTFACM